MWPLSSLTRDQTHVPCIGSWILYYWTTSEVLRTNFKLLMWHPGAWNREEMDTWVLWTNTNQQQDSGAPLNSSQPTSGEWLMKIGSESQKVLPFVCLDTHLFWKHFISQGTGNLWRRRDERFPTSRILIPVSEWLVCVSPCLQSQHYKGRHCFSWKSFYGNLTQQAKNSTLSFSGKVRR